MELPVQTRAMVEEFTKVRSLENENAAAVFERFVNETILDSHQPNGGEISDELLGNVSVGSGGDLGMDGICVKLNGLLVDSVDNAKDIVKQFCKSGISVEFIFVQSKMQDTFAAQDYKTFVSGVEDFLREKPYNANVMNENVKRWFEIKAYLYSNDVVRYWNDGKVLVHVYYVTLGKWNDQTYIVNDKNEFVDDMVKTGTYQEPEVYFIDADRLNKMRREHENLFTVNIETSERMALLQTTKVPNSNIVLCTANEFMPLLTTDEGLLRKGLFDDNVRDYQGKTVINRGILNTIRNDPEDFVLMNNGITIIASKVVQNSKTLSITSPRIVNGCQTCSVLYEAKKAGADLSKVLLFAKVIETQDDGIADKIVRGTNKQNIVYEEAFECTRDFHKNLESYFEKHSADENNKIYYERRAKQFSTDVLVQSWQKVSFRILIQSFVSVFLRNPHRGHNHESRLLADYKDKIFKDGQSELPYYVSSLIYIKSEVLYRRGDRATYKYKAFIHMIICLLANKNMCDINSKKSIEDYCNHVLPQIQDDNAFEGLFARACDVFNGAVNKWETDKGSKYASGIKDSAEFTKLLLSTLGTPPSAPARGQVIERKVGRPNIRGQFIAQKSNRPNIRGRIVAPPTTHRRDNGS